MPRMQCLWRSLASAMAHCGCIAWQNTISTSIPPPRTLLAFSLHLCLSVFLNSLLALMLPLCFAVLCCFIWFLRSLLSCDLVEADQRRALSISDVAWSCDDRAIGVASTTREGIVFDARTGQRIVHLRGHCLTCKTLAFHPHAPCKPWAPVKLCLLQF